MCSGLPVLPDSREPWTLLPPLGLVTAALLVEMGNSLVDKACSVRALSLLLLVRKGREHSD